MDSENYDLMAAMRLLDQLKLSGFHFERCAPGEDAPLVGNRVGGDKVDLIHIEGFSRDCFVWRQRISSLIYSRRGLVERQVEGSALDVLHEVLTWQTES
jgi:hypothetical protein